MGLLSHIWGPKTRSRNLNRINNLRTEREREREEREERGGPGQPGPGESLHFRVIWTIDAVGEFVPPRQDMWTVLPRRSHNMYLTSIHLVRSLWFEIPECNSLHFKSRGLLLSYSSIQIRNRIICVNCYGKLSVGVIHSTKSRERARGFYSLRTRECKSTDYIERDNKN